MLVVQKTVLLPDDDRREPVLHQDQVHQESRRATVPIHKGMNINLIGREISLLLIEVGFHTFYKYVNPELVPDQ